MQRPRSAIIASSSSDLRQSPRKRTKVALLSNSDKFHFAAALNNGAVSLLEDGKIAAGLELFQKSLALCGEAVRELNVQVPAPVESAPISAMHSSAGNDHHEDKALESQSRIDCSSGISITSCPLHWVEEAASQYTPQIHVEWAALRLNTKLLSSPTMQTFFVLTCIATFNVALCHQFLGTFASSSTSPTERKASLLKAAKGYELVHKMMSQNPELQNDVWVLLAVMNNVSRALVCANDEKRKVAHYNRRLLSILMFLCDRPDLTLPAGKFDKYFSNVCHLVLKRPQSAAAA